MILVCIGLYGVMSYAVSGRTSEIGIRIALGAQRGSVLWLILRESLLLVLVGVAIGIPSIFGAGKWISSLLFGVKPADPTALALALQLFPSDELTGTSRERANVGAADNPSRHFP